MDTDATAPQDPQRAAGPRGTSSSALSNDRVGVLRGAGVQADSRRLVRIGVTLVLVTLAVLAIVFTVVGMHKNAQIDQLRTHGVPVTFTVSGCLGLLGGSGSNAAGYSCKGAYTLDGHTYHVQLPGNTFHAPGSRVPSRAVPGDPQLVSPVAIVDTEHASSSVYILPAAFAGLFVLGVSVVLLRHHRARAA